MLNDHRFWGLASGPSSSGKMLPSFHPFLARPLDAPRPTKMGTIVSPWRYDAAINGRL
jgi:hypothetical protein